MPVVYQEGEYYRDKWGCLWYNIQEGLEGQVVDTFTHPGDLGIWDSCFGDSYPSFLSFQETTIRYGKRLILSCRHDHHRAADAPEHLVGLAIGTVGVKGFEKLKLDVHRMSPAKLNCKARLTAPAGFEFRRCARVLQALATSSVRA